jgi:hypothetical protein
MGESALIFTQGILAKIVFLQRCKGDVSALETGQ